MYNSERIKEQKTQIEKRVKENVSMLRIIKIILETIIQIIRDLSITVLAILAILFIINSLTTNSEAEYYKKQLAEHNITVVKYKSESLKNYEKTIKGEK